MACSQCNFDEIFQNGLCADCFIESAPSRTLSGQIETGQEADIAAGRGRTTVVIHYHHDVVRDVTHVNVAAACNYSRNGSTISCDGLRGGRTDLSGVINVVASKDEERFSPFVEKALKTIESHRKNYLAHHSMMSEAYQKAMSRNNPNA